MGTFPTNKKLKLRLTCRRSTSLNKKGQSNSPSFQTFKLKPILGKQTSNTASWAADSNVQDQGGGVRMYPLHLQMVVQPASRMPFSMLPVTIFTVMMNNCQQDAKSRLPAFLAKIPRVVCLSHPCTFRHSSEDRLEGKQPEF